MANRKPFKEATIIAERHGYILHRAKRHLIWRHACGAQVATSATPSDNRALKNFEAQLLRSLRIHLPQFA